MKRNTLLAAATVLAAALAVGSVQAQDKKFLTMDSFPAGSTLGQFGIAFTQIIQKNLPIEIQISIGKPATKSAMDASLQKVDLFVSAPSANHFMQTRTAMFAKVENAPELNSNLRNILNYPIGPYHIVAFEDSGIRSLNDIKGKKVFLGPPGGAATKLVSQIVQGATDLVPGEDFEVMRYDWQSAESAFLDRQIDVHIAPTSVPSPSIQQFALISKIRLLGIPDDAWDKPTLKAALSLPGRSIQEIPPGIYENQVNESAIKTIGSWGGLGTNRWLDEETVYQMTKTLWENIDDLYATAEWMKVINKDVIFRESNIPLHIGAYRYYREAGFDVPDNQIPPEAK